MRTGARPAATHTITMVRRRPFPSSASRTGCDRQRQRDLEAAARSGARTGGNDGAAVCLDQGLGDRQPDPGPPAGSVPRAVGTVEPFEDVREVVGGDALAAVGDTEVDVPGG